MAGNEESGCRQWDICFPLSSELVSPVLGDLSKCLVVVQDVYLMFKGMQLLLNVLKSQTVWSVADLD